MTCWLFTWPTPTLYWCVTLKIKKNNRGSKNCPNDWLFCLIYWVVSFDCNHINLNLIDTQHVLVYQMNFLKFLIMSFLHTIPIFPKCTNIGVVFRPIVLLQYICLTLLSLCVSPVTSCLSCHFISLLSLCISPLTGVIGLTPMCSMEFLPPLFHYSYCNILDILHVWCFSRRFPYCPCILSWYGSSLFYLLMTFGHWFAYFHMFGTFGLFIK